MKISITCIPILLCTVITNLSSLKIVAINDISKETILLDCCSDRSLKRTFSFKIHNIALDSKVVSVFKHLYVQPCKKQKAFQKCFDDASQDIETDVKFIIR